MPNGRPRQRNTRAANRQRNIQRASEVRAEAVQEAVVVQAEAVPEGRYYTNAEMDGLVESVTDRVMNDLEEETAQLRQENEKLKAKYNQAINGNLLSLQEVEIQDLQRANEALKAVTLRQRNKIQEWKKQAAIREIKIIKGAVFEGYNLCHLARESGLVKPLQPGEFCEAASSLGTSPEQFMKSIQKKYD